MGAYLRNCWYAAAWGADVSDAPVACQVLGEKLVLFRTTDGKPAALDDCCPHRLVPLSLGTVNGDTVRCGYHGMCFDVDGTCTEIPGQKAIPDRARVKAYPVAERLRLIWVWMGDPALADETTVPDLPWLDDSGWSVTGGTIRYNCHYLLLIDNLLDLSHTTFVHQATIGTDDVAWTPSSAIRENGSVMVTRELNDAEPSVFYGELGGFTGRIDRWQRIEFTPPANIVIDAGAVPAGTNDASRGIDTRVVNVLTPETDTSVLHFWAFARNFSLGDSAVDDLISDALVRTLNEDVAFLDGQQVLLDARPGQEMINNAADAGGVLARRMIDDLLAGEIGT